MGTPHKSAQVTAPERPAWGHLTGFSSSNCCPAVKKPGCSLFWAGPPVWPNRHASPFVLMLGTPSRCGQQPCQPASQELTACARASRTLLGGRCPHLRVSLREAGVPSRVWGEDPVSAPSSGHGPRCLPARATLGQHAPSFLPAAWSGQAWAWATTGDLTFWCLFPAVCPRGHRQGFLGRTCREPPMAEGPRAVLFLGHVRHRHAKWESETSPRPREGLVPQKQPRGPARKGGPVPTPVPASGASL